MKFKYFNQYLFVNKNTFEIILFRVNLTFKNAVIGEVIEVASENHDWHEITADKFNRIGFAYIGEF